MVPGETALAFYTAYNPTDKPITGVSTYNVLPMRAGLYFSKIQCFCFEEQRLKPHEEIDMPVFFFVDPAILDDPAMENVRDITLSYTFFRTGELDVLGVEEEAAKMRGMHANAAAALAGGQGAAATAQSQRIAAWTAEVAARTGISHPKLDEKAAAQPPATPV